MSIQLGNVGLKAHPIACDNYYVERSLTPRDENGEYDFECLQALDVELFNKHMKALLKGDKVEIPTFNFKKGVPEYTGNCLSIKSDEVLVVEGIHGLNDEFSYAISNSDKFKIYISAVTALNIDEHNRIPTTDNREIRRMVRDNRTRGFSARDTIARWQSVRHGEKKHIFPFQEDADVMFNSASIYELAVLKTFAEPLLFAIPHDSPEYPEAKRLLKFLEYFLGLSCEDVPRNSIIREFIGAVIADGDKERGHDGLEHAHGCRHTELSVQQADPVNKRVQDIAGGIHLFAVEVVNLVKARVQHIAQAQHHHQDNDHPHIGKGDIQHFLEAVRTVDGGGFILVRIDIGDGRQIDDRIESELLPDIRHNQGAAEIIVAAEKEDRFMSEQPQKTVHDPVARRQDVDQNAAQDDPAEEVGQIDQRLGCSAES